MSRQHTYKTLQEHYMKKILPVLFALSLSAAMAFAENPKAIIHTTAGDITVELLPAKAPNTVANFIGLATGKKAWTDPKTGEKVTGRPLYSGTIFHRTIPGFMIQGGDPLGNGMGGPGYKFDNENSDLTFDKPGVVAMANAGPNTNGSQFFITVAPKPYLNGGYTIFGQVTEGMDVVNKIVNQPTGAQDRPTAPTEIKGIDVIQTGMPASATAGTSTTATAPETTASK